VQDRLSQCVLDLEFDALSLYENANIPKQQIPGISELFPASSKGLLYEEFVYKPSIPFFNTFEKCHGVQKIIQVIFDSLEKW